MKAEEEIVYYLIGSACGSASPNPSPTQGFLVRKA